MGVGRHLGGAGLLIGLLLRMAVLVVGVWLITVTGGGGVALPGES